LLIAIKQFNLHQSSSISSFISQYRKNQQVLYHGERIGDINNQEEICKITPPWLDKQSRRTLTSPEKILMIKELIWRQRAKRQ
jgi:hypothetical protein